LGKHLLIGFDNGLTLRVHLGMHGAWDRLPRGPLPKGAGVILEGPDCLLICKRPKEVELFSTRLRSRHPILTALGPDLLGSTLDYEAIVARAQGVSKTLSVADLLVEQRVACGLGNVYRNELCFLGPLRGSATVPSAGLHPYRPWCEVPLADLIDIYRRGRELMLANLGGWARTTTYDPRWGLRPGERLWVYGHTGRPCLVCGSLIASSHKGDFARATQWCPRCQAPASQR
jgi:endonuclease-8